MVEGLSRLRRRLTKTIPGNVRNAARQALEKSANELVAEMRRLVPVDSGDLRDSIDWKWGNAPSGSVILAQAAGGDADMRITVYAGMRGEGLYDKGFYVRFVEFGTQNMPPTPFFFPSYRKLRRRIRGRMTRDLKKAIRANR